jgi:hypothetical protein
MTLDFKRTLREQDENVHVVVLGVVSLAKYRLGLGLLILGSTLFARLPAMGSTAADASANPDAWPAAASPAAITSPRTEAAITALLAKNED